MTVPLHMFMKDLLVGAEFDHHSAHHHHYRRHQQPHKHQRSSGSSSSSSNSSEDSIRLVVDNARSHPLPTKKRHSSSSSSPRNSHNRQTMKDAGIDMKKIQQGRCRQRLMMDISDHSKRESRWGGIDKKVTFSSSTDFHNKQQHEKSLDVSDHSKKDTRWNSSRLTLEETLSRAIMNHPQRRSRKSTDKPPPAKVLDVSDHTRRESRWDSIEAHQERGINDCHSMSPIKDLLSRRRAGRAVRSGRSRSNDCLDTMKFLSEWRQQQSSHVNHHRSEVGNSSAPTIMMDDNEDNCNEGSSSNDAVLNEKRKKHQANTRLALEQVEQAIELVSAALREQSLK